MQDLPQRKRLCKSRYLQPAIEDTEERHQCMTQYGHAQPQQQGPSRVPPCPPGILLGLRQPCLLLLLRAAE